MQWPKLFWVVCICCTLCRYAIQFFYFPFSGCLQTTMLHTKVLESGLSQELSDLSIIQHCTGVAKLQTHGCLSTGIMTAWIQSSFQSMAVPFFFVIGLDTAKNLLLFLSPDFANKVFPHICNALNAIHNNFPALFRSSIFLTSELWK